MDAPDNHELDGDHFADTEQGPLNAPSPAPDAHHIHSSFIGLDDALFHNYHPGLTGQLHFDGFSL